MTEPLAVSTDAGAVPSTVACATPDPDCAEADPALDLEPALTAAIGTPLGTWDELGPNRGGRLDGIVVRRSDGAKVVASPGGGVWRKLAGSGWEQPASVGLTDWTVVHLEWDLLDPARLWTVTWNGLYYTDDLGDTFVGVVNSGGVPTTPHVGSVPIDARPFAQMRLAGGGRVVLFGRPCLGLWWSFDGENFDFQFPFPADEEFENDNCIGTIAADNVTHRVLVTTQVGNDETFVSTRVLRSCPWAEGAPCLDWAPLSTCEGEDCICGSPSDCILPREIASAMTVSATGRAVLAIVTGPVAGRPTVHYELGSDDVWRPSSRGQDRNQTSPRYLRFMGGDLFEGNRDAWWANDFASAWRRLSDDEHHVDHNSIYADVGLRRVWSVTDGEGNGEDGLVANMVRWTYRPGFQPTDATRISVRGIRAIQSYFIAVIPQTSTTVRRFFTGTQDNNAFCAPRADLNAWSYIGAADLGGDVLSFQYFRADPNRAYVLNNNGELSITTAAGVASYNPAFGCLRVHYAGWTKRQVPAPLTTSWGRNMMAVHPSRPRTVYVASSRRTVLETTTAGVGLWPETSPFSSAVTSLYADESHIYAGTENGVFRRLHDGPLNSWVPFGLDVDVVPWPPSTWAYLPNVLALTSASASDPLWAATTQGLYRREVGFDEGWELSLARPGAFSDVLVDPTCPQRVYASMGVQIGGSAISSRRHGGGVWASADGGESWQSITQGTLLDHVPIADLEMDPSEPEIVYIATHGRGVWRWTPLQPPACGGGPQ